MEVKLKAEKREGSGKGVARKIRAAGKVPGVLYGPDQETISLQVDARDLRHALHTDAGANVLIDLKVDEDSYLSMPREVQRDVLRGEILHVDLLRIRKDVAIQVEVPVHLTGESAGVKMGGVVEHHLWQIRLECLPAAVPESLEADITALEIGDALHVSDLQIPDGATLVTPAEEILVTVVPPPVLKLEEEEVAEVAEGEVAEGEEGAAPAEGEAGAAPAEGEGGG